MGSRKAGDRRAAPHRHLEARRPAAGRAQAGAGSAANPAPGAAVEDRARPPVDMARDRFPQLNDWLFAVVTIRTQDGQETLAIPTIDVPLVHAALELANAEG